MQQPTDPYRALGVPRGATELEIKAAHRKLVKRYHPDTGTQSETDRFLSVQEAYRILSDPLLRKEWDLKHAPGPVRADRTAGTTTRRRRPPTPKPATEPAETTAPPPRTDNGARSTADPRTQPRSTRAYTWSASEVPWWEEARTDKKPSAKASPSKAKGKHPPQPDAEPGSPSGDEPVFTQQDFDVYNRSSGAAWSMAARAYFRKGDSDLPRRGSFRRQGTQVVTAGRARAAGEAEARRHAADEARRHAADEARQHAADEARQQPADEARQHAADEARHHAADEARQRAAAQAQARRRAAAAASVAGANATYAHAAPPPRPGTGTTHIVRRTIAEPWPSISQRFVFALIAWLPIAAIMAAAVADQIDQLVGWAFISAALLLLLFVPRLAYIAALATLLVLVVGGLFVGAVLLAGWLPALDRLAVYIGGLLVVGYIATAAVIAIGPSTLRPWSER